MEKNEYRLIIDINNGEGGGNTAISKKDSQEQIQTKQERALKNLVRYQIAQPFINATKQIIQNEIDTRVGSSELSQRISLGMNVLHQGYSTLTYGASLGSVLGIGAAGGIAVAVGVAIAKFTVDTIAKSIELSNKTKLENEQLSILRGRAGIQFNRSRMGE